MTPFIAVHARDALNNALAARLSSQAQARLAAWSAEAAKGSKRALFTGFSALPGVVGKGELAPTERELAEAKEWAAGCGLARWSIDQAARAVLLLHYPAEPQSEQVEALRLLFSAGDVREQAALLRFLPLLPHPALYRSFAELGVRSSITALLEAIAFDNAYPCAQFDTAQWNRMVLKVLFQDLGVERILGLRARANAELSRMAQDLAQERRSAKRPLPPGLDLVLQAKEAK